MACLLLEESGHRINRAHQSDLRNRASQGYDTAYQLGGTRVCMCVCKDDNENIIVNDRDTQRNLIKYIIAAILLKGTETIILFSDFSYEFLSSHMPCMIKAYPNKHHLLYKQNVFGKQKKDLLLSIFFQNYSSWVL
ncbi:G protein-activated inward rectifier potassium channel 1-like [Platysternon megacephalum]|uniref:G protein-activated inward rectifier potassium channel 1-like n=1 Tax=Platysternon megacephalum TaxID=55544 RepID=A0A4D9EJY6_9SAUR|nr:G protein-activated inward rectifier potassium channel 1-like [Platysternon megacephalum]